MNLRGVATGVFGNTEHERVMVIADVPAHAQTEHVIAGPVGRRLALEALRAGGEHAGEHDLRAEQ